MSIKFYKAYRAKPYVDLWYLVEEVYQAGRKEAVACIKSFYEVMLMGVDTTSLAYARELGNWGDDYAARLAIVHSNVVENYGRSQSLLQRSPFNLDVSISFHPHDGRIHLIPYCDGYMAHSLDFLSTHPLLEDFSYWDNKDKPEDTPMSEWTYRSGIWGEVVEQWAVRLILDIVGFPGFSNVDPFLDLMRVSVQTDELRTRLEQLKKLDQGLCPNCGQTLDTKDSLLPDAKWTTYRCKGCGYSTRVHIRMKVVSEGAEQNG
jgi:predicted RNA-binding Zn-ribbon protein involved in translation (DUF1610 family)